MLHFPTRTASLVAEMSIIDGDIASGALDRAVEQRERGARRFRVRLLICAQFFRRTCCGGGAMLCGAYADVIFGISSPKVARSEDQL
jgi:hypothetical protein